MNHTVELVRRHENRDYGGHCRDVWTIRIDGVEMKIVLGSQHRKNKSAGEFPKYLKFDNALVTKHEDYKIIRSLVLYELDLHRNGYYIEKEK